MLLPVLAAACGVAHDGARLCPTLPSSAPRSPAILPTIVLVTLDGVRAQEIFGRPDLVPNLRRLMARGVALGGPGAPMVASGPRYVSLPGYREILTGRRCTTCRDNRCPAIQEPTLLDELRVLGHLDQDDVVTLASWEVITRAASAAPSAITISAGRHGGPTRALCAVDAATRRDLDAGAHADAWPGHGDYRPDAYTAALALDYIAAARPRVLWVALGDTDEYAHRGDYDAYLRALAAADAFVGRLVQAVGLDDTILLVTADHGRAADFRDHGDAPESRAVWLIAAGGPIPRRGAVHTDTAHRLSDIAPTVRALLHLGPDESPRAGAPIPELLGPAVAGAPAPPLHLLPDGA